MLGILHFCPLCRVDTELCIVGCMRWSIKRCSRCLIKYHGNDWFALESRKPKKYLNTI